MKVRLARRRSALFGCLLLVTLALIGCASPSAAPAGAVGALSVLDPVARPGPAEGISGAFLTVVNTGATSDRLLAARTAIAPTTELHETFDDNGVLRMRLAATGFEVPANGRLELKPGGKHMMFVGLTAAVTVGSEIEITLVFEQAGELTIKAPVKQ